MKKKLIAAGAASLAVAAMPVVGVFATTGVYGDVVGSNKNVIDTVTLTVEKTCQMEVSNSYALSGGQPAEATGDYGGTYHLGTSTVAHVFDGTASDSHSTPVTGGGIQGTPMTLTCNGAGANSGADAGIGWSLSATATPLARALANNAVDQYAIQFGAYPTETPTAATNSVWSAKLNLSLATGSHTVISSDTAVTEGWDSYGGTTASDTTILKGVAGRSVEGLIVTPSYKAYGAASQPVGTYTGTITYTFHDLSN